MNLPNNNMKKTQIIAAALLLLASSLASMADHDHEKTTAAFIETFKRADAEGMAKYFSENVKFVGDHRFIDRQESLSKPIEISRSDLLESYNRLFALCGKEKWKRIVSKVKPSISVSENGGELKGYVKKGDVICDMNFREATKGKRNGVDEAVIFVFRREGDAYKVVFHLADY